MGKAPKTPHLVALERLLADKNRIHALELRRESGGWRVILARDEAKQFDAHHAESLDLAVRDALKAAGLGAGVKGAISNPTFRDIALWLQRGDADSLAVSEETPASDEYPLEDGEEDDWGDVWIRIVTLGTARETVEGWGQSFSDAVDSLLSAREWKPLWKRMRRKR